ncbi:flagellar hook-length control protein FliK [Dyella koreensis]|uniref:Flagellar hook-length control protein FliK n=1 Tax=Dyella koreensis TaxID=311235 RepID=A0ABW8K5Q1_9GAMM
MNLLRVMPPPMAVHACVGTPLAGLPGNVEASARSGMMVSLPFTPPDGAELSMEADLQVMMPIDAGDELPRDDASEFPNEMTAWLAPVAVPGVFIESNLAIPHVQTAPAEHQWIPRDASSIAAEAASPSMDQAMALQSPRGRPLDAAQIVVLAAGRPSSLAVVSTDLERQAPRQGIATGAPNAAGVQVSPGQHATPREAGGGVVSASIADLSINVLAVSSPASPTQVSGKLPATEAVHAPEQRLINVLGERIQVLHRQGIQQAVIQLDPHLSGSVRIELAHDAGALHVRISASHAEVAQQLQTICEALRQDLHGRQPGEVTVQVHHSRFGEQGGQGGQSSRDGQDCARDEPGRALATDSDGDTFGALWKRFIASRGYAS